MRVGHIAAKNTAQQLRTLCAHEKRITMVALAVVLVRAWHACETGLVPGRGKKTMQGILAAPSSSVLPSSTRRRRRRCTTRATIPDGPPCHHDSPKCSEEFGGLNSN